MAATIPERVADAGRRSPYGERVTVSDTVVLVDPELDPGSGLVARLRERGIALHVYPDVLRALARVGAGDVHMLVLSASLGQELLVMVVDAARQEVAVPIVVAHAAGEIDAIGPAVVAGARPLLTRPYRPDAVAGVLNDVRLTERPAPVLVVGELRLDVSTYDVRFAGHGIDLATRELEFLAELAAQPDHVVPRLLLYRRIWPHSIDPDAVLIATAARLRRKLRPFGVEQAVHTVRGVGYRLDSATLVAPAAVPAVDVPSSAVSSAASPAVSSADT